MITDLKIEKEYDGGKYFEVLVTAKDRSNTEPYTYKATYSKNSLKKEQLKMKMILAGASEDDVEELESMAYSNGYDEGHDAGFNQGQN